MPFFSVAILVDFIKYADSPCVVSLSCHIRNRKCTTHDNAWPARIESVTYSMFIMETSNKVTGEKRNINVILPLFGWQALNSERTPHIRDDA